MDTDSEIWIDELVVPDQRATEAQVNQDWTMLAAVAGIERSESQWINLLGDAGLSIRKIQRFDPGRGAAVIVAALK